MMIVTKVIEYNKTKVLVQIDEHFTFPLYNTEYNKFALKEGCEISTGIYREITEQILPKRVKLRAMKLLEKRAYTKETLRRKLVEGKYPSCFIEEALEYVSRFHYIDDAKYAEDYIHCYATKRSKKQIFLQLQQKGVSMEEIESAWLNYEKSNEPIDEIVQIKAIMCKKQFDIRTADYDTKRKMFQYLLRKGYDYNNIQNCMQFEEDYSS